MLTNLIGVQWIFCTIGSNVRLPTRKMSRVPDDQSSPGESVVIAFHMQLLSKCNYKSAL